MFKRKWLTLIFLAVLAWAFISGCKKVSPEIESIAAKRLTTTQNMPTILSGKYLVSGSYSHMGCTHDTQYYIPPTALYVVKTGNDQLRIDFQPYFTIDACTYGSSYPGAWSGNILGPESTWWNNTFFTVYRDSITIQIGTGFNTGYASQPCVGGHTISGKLME